MSRVIKIYEDIRELRDGWLNGTTGRHHVTAVAAWRAVKRRAKQIMKDAPEAIVVQVITWHPITDGGRAIAKSFQK